MSIEQHVLQQMLGEAALIRFELAVALAKEKAEVKRLTADLAAAQDKLLYFEAEEPRAD